MNKKLFFLIANKKKFITGRVEMLKTGKAYIVSDEGGDDIFMLKEYFNHIIRKETGRLLLFGPSLLSLL